MSNYLKKGKRQLKAEQAKNTKVAMARFQQTLMIMNETYHKLMGDPTVSLENFDNKVKEITDFNFTEKQYAMLYTDVTTNKGLLTTTDEQEEDNI